MRHCEICGVSGMFIEVREVWIDGAYFGTFCCKCERDGRGEVPPRRRAQNSADVRKAEGIGRLPVGRARRR
jgi:hypothetical protein